MKAIVVLPYLVESYTCVVFMFKTAVIVSVEAAFVANIETVVVVIDEAVVPFVEAAVVIPFADVVSFLSTGL